MSLRALTNSYFVKFAFHWLQVCDFQSITYWKKVRCKLSLFLFSILKQDPEGSLYVFRSYCYYAFQQNKMPNLICLLKAVQKHLPADLINEIIREHNAHLFYTLGIHLTHEINDILVCKYPSDLSVYCLKGCATMYIQLYFFIKPIK